MKRIPFSPVPEDPRRVLVALNMAGIMAEDRHVIQGVAIANMEKFFTFTSGRILSIDY